MEPLIFSGILTFYSSLIADMEGKFIDLVRDETSRMFDDLPEGIRKYKEKSGK